VITLAVRGWVLRIRLVRTRRRRPPWGPARPQPQSFGWNHNFLRLVTSTWGDCRGGRSLLWRYSCACGPQFCGPGRAVRN